MADSMTKAELIAQVADEAGITKKEASDAVDAVTGAIQGALEKGKKVTLTGFGTFATSERAARTGRNPQTGAPIKIAASTGVRFKPGAVLKKAVNK